MINDKFYDSYEKITNFFSIEYILNLLYNILKFSLVFIILPFSILSKIFKYEIKLSIFANFQLYFFISWIPIFILLGGAHKKKIFIEGLDNLLILIFAILLFLCIRTYLKSICILLKISTKRGILLLLVSFILPPEFINLASKIGLLSL